MVDRPQKDVINPEVSRQEIDAMHARHMAHWAEMELTPERLAAIRQEAKDKVTNKRKPWEDE